LEKISDERKQRGGRCQFHARSLDVAFKVDNRAGWLSITPQAECVAIRVNKIWKRLELVPLLLVMGVVELAWVGALARRLDFDEANKRIVHGSGEIRTRFQASKGRFADKLDRARRSTRDLSQVSNERLERPRS
jgi:hypothetical protein